MWREIWLYFSEIRIKMMFNMSRKTRFDSGYFFASEFCSFLKRNKKEIWKEWDKNGFLKKVQWIWWFYWSQLCKKWNGAKEEVQKNSWTEMSRKSRFHCSKNKQNRVNDISFFLDSIAWKAVSFNFSKIMRLEIAHD